MNDQWKGSIPGESYLGQISQSPLRIGRDVECGLIYFDCADFILLSPYIRHSMIVRKVIKRDDVHRVAQYSVGAGCAGCVILLEFQQSNLPPLARMQFVIQTTSHAGKDFRYPVKDEGGKLVSANPRWRFLHYCIDNAGDTLHSPLSPIDDPGLEDERETDTPLHTLNPCMCQLSHWDKAISEICGSTT